MPTFPPHFDGIKLNTKKKSACSPRIADDFRGLRIVTPDRIDLGDPWHDGVGSNVARPVLPVCGTLRVGGDTAARFSSLSNQILLVAVDARQHASYVANLVARGMTPEVSPPPTPAELEEWKDTIETSYFNANAFYYLQDLPAAPGRYHVFAMLGDIVSNLRTVEVVGEGSEKSARKLAPGEARFGKHAQPPAVAPDFRGVRIQARVSRWPKEGPVWIDGVAQVGTEDAAALAMTPIQKALVVTVSSGLLCRSWNPSGEQALFTDDQERQGQVVRGAFGFDVAKAFGSGLDEGVYVMVSLGATLSNVLFIPPS